MEISLDVFDPAQLPSFDEFAAVVGDEAYWPAPDDWVVVIGDVRSSTKAIEDGRYRDVNLLGAACISTANDILDGEFPFVFGGDGASVLVPKADEQGLLTGLLDLAEKAQSRFGLELRVGSVPVHELRARGFDVEVARHRLASGSHVSVLRGGGFGGHDEIN